VTWLLVVLRFILTLAPAFATLGYARSPVRWSLP